MTTLDEARRLHRELDKALMAGIPAEPHAVWLECTQDRYIPMVYDCAEALAPHIHAVYFTVQYMSVLEKLVLWCKEHHPHLTVYGGFSAMQYWECSDGSARPLEDYVGWRNLRDSAMAVHSITGQPICLINNERRLRAFNEGNETIDYPALEQAIRESGVADCGVEMRWYMPKFYPEKPWTCDLAATYARGFPTSKLLAGYAGKPANLRRADFPLRWAVTNQLWRADRIIHHIYVHHSDRQCQFYAPVDVPARLRTLPGPKILWIEGENKIETARQTAAAFEAAGEQR